MQYLAEWFSFVNVVVVLGAIFGSVKTCMALHQDANLCDSILDIFIGVFCGILVGLHFSNELNVPVSGLIALVAGAAGAIILEVIVEMLPSAARKYITRYLKHHK